MLAAQEGLSRRLPNNVDAQVAEGQLMKVLQDLISSSLKSCQMSMVVAVRTSKPARNRLEREEAERTLAARRQHVLHSIARMNGGRGIPETLARSVCSSGAPGDGGREQKGTRFADPPRADLLPVEMPWRGTPNSPLMLFETPHAS